ncbi:MAG: hypothetical protein ACREM8_10780, partial [Vulcanimicrobiaceae bacterium]
VMGSLTLGFETETMLQLFWGAPTATGPQGAVMPVNLEFDVFSQDYINSAVRYALKAIFAGAMLTADDVPVKSNSYITQQVKFEAYESANGASDDAKFILTNAASGNSI